MSQVQQRRRFLALLFEAARLGESEALVKCVNDQCREWNRQDSDGDGESTTTVVTAPCLPSHLLVEAVDGNKRNVLHFACQSHPKNVDDDNSNDIVEVILNNLNWFPATNENMISLLRQKDKDGLTPLMLASQHSDPILSERRVLFLLEKGKGAKLALERSRTGATALHYASGSGATPATVRALHHAGKAAIHSFSRKGGTPLHYTCCYHRPNTTGNDGGGKSILNTLETLIECGADVNAHQWQEEGDDNEDEDDGRRNQSYAIPPPVLMAAVAGNDPCCQRLLQCAGIDLMVHLTGNTILHQLAERNLVASLQTMLERLSTDDSDKKGVLLTQKNAKGQTPLDVAAQQCHVECTAILLGARESPPAVATQENVRAFMEDHGATEKNDHAAHTSSSDESNEPDTAASGTGFFEKTETIFTSGDIPDKTLLSEVMLKAAGTLASLSTTDKQQTKELEKFAAFHKVRGNNHFAKKQWQDAYEEYTRAIQANRRDATFYSNRSACLIQMCRPHEALEDAVFARTLRPDWSKACYRTVVALLAFQEQESGTKNDDDLYEEAAMVAWAGLQLEPENTDLKILLRKCAKLGRQAHRRRNHDKIGANEKG